jgi:hypothetical protein
MLHSASAVATLTRANYEQLRQLLIDGNYITRQQLEQDLARLDDADFMMPSPVLWSAWGRRP